MEIYSKDYGVLFKLLIADRMNDVIELKEEYKPGYFFSWPPKESSWFWPRLKSKAEMEKEIYDIYNSETYHEFGDLCGIAEHVYRERSHASYWCGPVFGAKTRKEFEKECRKNKVIFRIDEDIYNLFCEPKKRTGNYNPNSNMRKRSSGVGRP